MGESAPINKETSYDYNKDNDNAEGCSVESLEGKSEKVKMDVEEEV